MSPHRLQTILLTGASEGMGCSLAKLLASRGANLVLVSRNVGKLEEAVAAAQVCIVSALPLLLLT